jgi:hypothetical protein
MNNINWVIVNYPPGSGGKFISNCLMQYDSIPFWGGNMTKEQRIEYFCNLLPDNCNDSWVRNDMIQPWGLNFFSRIEQRNNNISTRVFYDLLQQHASDYLNETIARGAFVLDYWHKTDLPIFWRGEFTINIVIDDLELYKRLLFTKPYTFNAKTKTITSLLDLPLKGKLTKANNKNVKLFNNQHKFDNIDIDQFFDNVIKDKLWFKDRMVNRNLPNTIYLSELFDFDKLYGFLCKFNARFNEQLPKNNIRKLHTVWLQKTTLFLSNL